MDFMQPLIKHILYPLWMCYDGAGKGISSLDRFSYIDGLDREALLASQRDGLRKLFIHAWTNTDYYREVFDSAGISPVTMDIPGDIARLPILTKDIVRKRFTGLKAKNIPEKELVEAKTGGSTGIPLLFLRDRQCEYLRRGQELYFDRWMGYELGKKVGFFVAGSHYHGLIAGLKARIRNATCERALHFNPDNITDEYMEAFARRLQKFRPEIIKSFPNTLGPFVEYVNRRNISMPRVKAVSCTGENLLDQQRTAYEKTFGAPVFQKVGTRESGVIACECSLHQGMHVFTEGVYLEIIRDDMQPAGPGEMGRVLLTDLFNRAMPLIRYEIGDMAIAGGDRSCPCGSPLPLLERYLGRDRDVIIDSDGNPKPGYLFTQVIKILNLNAQIQVVQTHRDRLVVRVVRNEEGSFDPDTLQNEYRKLVGENMRIEFEFPEKIERDPSGKFSYVKSLVSGSLESPEASDVEPAPSRP